MRYTASNTFYLYLEVFARQRHKNNLMDESCAIHSVSVFTSRTNYMTGTDSVERWHRVPIAWATAVIRARNIWQMEIKNVLRSLVQSTRNIFFFYVIIMCQIITKRHDVPKSKRAQSLLAFVLRSRLLCRRNHERLFESTRDNLTVR